MAIRSELPKVPFRKSLSRVILLKGLDRRLFTGTIVLSGYLGFAGFVAWGPWVGSALGLGMLVLLLKSVTWLTRDDDRWLDVFLRSRKYKGFYPARGHLKSSRSHPNWTK